MSVELTTMANDALPVNPQKGQENAHRAVKKLAGDEANVEKKLIAVRETSELESVIN